MSLAETIERDLADRIQSGRALPARLTLGALADAYGVSATPVRTAVDGLVRRRLVRRDGSGRLSVRGGERCDATAIEAPIQLARDLDGEVAEELILVSLGGGGFRPCLAVAHVLSSSGKPRDVRKATTLLPSTGGILAALRAIERTVNPRPGGARSLAPGQTVGATRRELKEGQRVR